jgi:hypothetical protein
MKQALAILLLFIMAIAACGDGQVDRAPERPEFYLRTADGTLVGGQTAGGCWPHEIDDTLQMICSHIDLNFDPDAAVALPIGGLIGVELHTATEPDTVSLNLIDPATYEPIAYKDFISSGEGGLFEWTPDVPTGEYVLRADGYWDEIQGSIGNTFSVLVP